MTHPRIIALLATCTLVAGGCVHDGDQEAPPQTTPPTPPSADEARLANVDLDEQDGSGIEGVAVLRDEDGSTRIVVDLMGADDGEHPVHLYASTCDDLGDDPAHELEPAVNGRSETVVDVAFDDLAEDPWAISVREGDAGDDATSAACGDITEAAASEPPGDAPVGDGPPQVEAPPDPARFEDHNDA